jgi:hypothetical protein
MAKKKSTDDNTSNKVLWIGGAAAVTAFAMFYVNRHLNEKEELNRLRYTERQKLSEKSESSEE